MKIIVNPTPGRLKWLSRGGFAVMRNPGLESGVGLIA